MKAKIVSLRFTSFILVVIFLLHSLRNCLAHAHQAKAVDGFETARINEDHVFAHKALNHVPKTKKVAIGGRKMMKSHELQEDDHEVMNNGATPALSGDEGRNNLKDYSSERSFDDSQNQVTAFHNPGSSKTALAKSDNPSTQNHESEARNDESKRLFEATKEIMKLMHKDYGGRWRPKRKPPINNRIPKN